MKGKLYNILLAVFAAVFLISGITLAVYYIQNTRQETRYQQIAKLRGDETTPRPAPEDTSPTEPAYNYVTVPDPETGEHVKLLPEFAQLYATNNDIVGWIKIPGTDINYPVMQTPDEPDYYLKRNFDKASSARGAIYVREVCDVFAPSDNLTIYGHRMQSGAMFGQLDRYLSADFCAENPYIYFDTLKALHTYQILAVFVTSATQGEGFQYHLFVDAVDAAEFDGFVAQCKELSLYETGVDAVYGDKLITRSTCEYTRENGRLVVVAKCID